VGVHADHRIDYLGQHRHRLLPSVVGNKESAPAWMEITEWHICDGSRR
jgi:hypothetical protein